MKIILILELNVMKSVHLVNFTELGLRQCLTLRPATTRQHTRLLLCHDTNGNYFPFEVQMEFRDFNFC